MAGPGDRERRTPGEGEPGLSNLGEAYRKASPYIAASTTLVAAVGVLTGVGVWLDRKWGTTPWLTLLGLVLGMAGGFTSFIRTVLGKRT